MTDRVGHLPGVENAEAVLRRELARGDAMAETLLPVLRHLVAAEADPAVSEEILAHVRGMLADLAQTLLDDGAGDDPMRERLIRALLEDPAILAHLHALALEWQLARRLQARLALDPVASPLLQALISSPHADTRDRAMAFLAAQARWCQAQRRMKLGWSELPADLLDAALIALRATAGEAAARTEATIRRSYDEAAGRLALAARLLVELDQGGLDEGGVKGGAPAALSIAHAGASLFLTALALASGTAREAAVLSTHPAQMARLALALKGAGLGPAQVREQVMALHGHAALPAGIDGADGDLAARILASGPPA